MATKPALRAIVADSTSAAEPASTSTDVEAKSHPLTIERIADGGQQDLATVVAFHRKGADFLGRMPRGAFEDYAHNGGLVLARRGSIAVGYAMFATTDRYVRLIHVFVDEPWRSAGVARSLVDWISHETRDRPGIRVSSRRDHGRRDLWARLGFVRRGERPGRGQDREPLVIWWREHEHPGLFEPSLDSVLVRAAVDMNIVRDRVEANRLGREASLALTADHMRDQLAVFRTPTLDIEIDQLTDPSIRQRANDEAAEFMVGRVDDLQRRAAAARLRDARARSGKGGQLISDRDIDYVSEAIACSLDVFVSRDARLARHVGDEALAHGLRILRPEETVVRIDELTRRAAYHPRAFEGTDLAIHLLGPGEHERLLFLVSADHGESRSMFSARVADLTRAGCDRLIVEGRDRSIVACLMTRRAGTVLEVPMFRVRNDSLGPTVARQLLFRLRRDARSTGISVIRLTDPHPSRPINAATEDDGYVWERGIATALVIDVAGSTEEVQVAIHEAEQSGSVAASPMLRPPLSVRQVAELERTRWPMKILDGPLPTYVVSIKQRYATTLLNVPQGLLDRATPLGMSRTHVYYRSVGGGSPKAPSRLLWYLTKNRVAPAGIVATSHLDQVVEDDPDVLFERFEHLGVWSRDEVRKAGREGSAQALVFSDTEVFDEAVSYAETVAMIKSAPMSPRLVKPDVFARVYVGRGQRD
jgi:GNAT superfamily N-acetyltransferase